MDCPSGAKETGSTSARAPLAVDDAFREHHTSVMRQVQRLMGDPDDTYDLTLLTWEKAQRAWDRRPAVALEVRPWLFRIARNACLDELRRRQLLRWEPLEGRRGPGTDEDAHPGPVTTLRSSDFQPEQETLRAERLALVRSALRTLPRRYRVCLLMREAEGLSCDEIGAALNLSPGAVRTTLCRARKRLRQAYLDLGGEPAAA